LKLITFLVGLNRLERLQSFADLEAITLDQRIVGQNEKRFSYVRGWPTMTAVKAIRLHEEL
jgi:hypothetical protein